MPFTDPGWAAFVDVHPSTTGFHRPEWSQLLAECYGYRGFVLVQTGSDGAIEAGMPILEVRQLSLRRRWVCLPFSDQCPPLASSTPAAEQLLTGADQRRRAAKVEHLEVRAELSDSPWPAQIVAVTHSQPLYGDGEKILAAFGASARRNVRLAHRNGVRVRRSVALSDVETFYRLHVDTRHRQGVPVQPHRYFRLLWKWMISAGHGMVLVAEHHDVPVAAALFLLGGRTITYKYGASDPAFWRLRANSLVMWEAMSWAAGQGYTTFDWGRSDVNNVGLREFKSSLGGRERPLSYTRLPSGSLQLGGGRAAEALRPVLTRAPSWVCRIAGELMYRYAG